MPAASRPSEASFSSCKSLEVNSRARSSIVCTSAAVTCGHVTGMSATSSRGTNSASAASSTTVVPDATPRREYGRTPVTSPSLQSITLRGAPPRWLKCVRRPFNMMYMPATGSPGLTGRSPTS